MFVLSASPKGAAPVSPILFPLKSSVVSEVLLLNASPIGTAPISPMLLLLKLNWGSAEKLHTESKYEKGANSKK